MSGWQDAPVAPAVSKPTSAWDSAPEVVEKDPSPALADKLVASSPTLKDATNPYEAFVAGLHMSASVIPFSKPMMQVPANAGFFSKLAGSVGQGIGDLPANIVGAFGGATVGVAAGAAVPGAGETGVSEAIGGVVGAGAGATALPQAVRETMMDYYADKDKGVMTASDFFHQVAHSAWNVGKAGVVGAIGGAVGGKAAGVVADAGGSAFSSTAANVVGFSAGVTGAQAALDHKVPDAQDFTIGAITALGLGAAGHMAAGKFVPSDAGERVMDNSQKIYRQTGVPPWQQADMAKRDPKLLDELVGRDVNGDPVAPKFNATRPPEPEQPTPEAKPFKTNPGKIADEHEQEMSSLATDAHVAAHVKELLPQIKALETGGAKDPDAAISHTGAVGRYQIQPGTARQYGFDPARLHEPAYNEMVARHVLADLSRRFHGDTEAVLVAYNAGPGRAITFLRDGRDTTKLPYETQGYLTKAGFGGKGGEPPEPPIPPEEPPASESPREVPSAREQDFSKLTDEMMVSRFQDSIGEEPERPSTGSNIMRQWVSELESARAIDKQITAAGLQNPNKDITFEDMMRQTYASDDRTNYMLMKGNIDPVTLDPKDGPSLVDVLGKIKEGGGNMDEFDAYRVAQRTLDLNERGVNTGVFKGGVAEAGSIIQRPAFQKYRAINDEMQKWKRGGLEYGRDSGLFAQRNVDAMEAASSHVSLRRVGGDDAAFKTTLGGPRGLKVSNPLKRMEGSNRQIVKPLLADIDNMRQIIRMSDRNRAIGHLLGGQDALDAGTRKTLEDMGIKMLPAPEVKAMLAEPGSSKFAPYNLTPEQTEAIRPFAIEGNKGANSGNRFTYYRNGVPEVWEARDPDLAALMRGAENKGDATTISVFGKIINLDKVLSTPAKLERAGIMGNLDTALTVPGKHQLTAWTLDPLHPPPYITMVKGMKDVLTKGDAYWDLMRRGGLSGALTDMDMAKAVDTAVGDQGILKETGSLERVWNTTTHPLHFAQQITEALTQGEKIGYYKRAVATGLDPNKAAMMSRRAYLDFSEKAAGVVANRMAKNIPFFRAALLGIKYVRDGVEADAKGAFLRVSLGLVGGQVAMYALNRIADQGLDDKDKYTSLPQWERDQYFITPPIMGVRHKLGRPYVIGPLVGVPLERMIEAEYEKNPHAFDDFLKDWVGDIVPSMIPATVRPALEQISNHNFFAGKPLISDNLKQMTPDMQYAENTSEVAKKVSSLLGDHTGLGVTNVSPIVIDNYVQAWSGTVGMTVLHALDAPLGKNTETKEWSDNIFVRGFVIQNPRMGTAQMDDFYKDAAKFTETNRDAIMEARSGNMDQALADKGAAGQKASMVVHVEHALTTIRSALKAVQTNDKMNLDEKRQLSQRMYQDAWQIANTASKVLRGGTVSDDDAKAISDRAEQDIGAAGGE